MNKIEFEKKYYDIDKEYFDKIGKEYVDRVNAFFSKQIIFLFIMTVIPSFLIFILFKENSILQRTIITFVYECLIILFNLYMYKKQIKTISYNINEKLIERILYIITDNNSEFVPDNRISKSSFNKTNIFDLNKAKYNGKNYIKAKYMNNEMVFGDVEIYYNEKVYKERTIYRNNKKYIQTISQNKKKVLFEGSYIGAELNTPIYHSIYLIPESNVSYKINSFIDLNGDLMELENLDFEKNYKVYTNNEIKAREILTLSFMEKINDLEKLFPYRKYIVFKDDGRMSILIHNKTIESLKEKLVKLNQNEIDINYIKDLFEEINNYFKVYEILELDKNQENMLK